MSQILVLFSRRHQLDFFCFMSRLCCFERYYITRWKYFISSKCWIFFSWKLQTCSISITSENFSKSSAFSIIYGLASDENERVYSLLLLMILFSSIDSNLRKCLSAECFLTFLFLVLPSLPSLHYNFTAVDKFIQSFRCIL